MFRNGQNILFALLLSAIGLLATEFESLIKYQPTNEECQQIKTMQEKIMATCNSECGGFSATDVHDAEHINQNIIMRKCLFAQTKNNCPAVQETYKKCSTEHNNATLYNCGSSSGIRFLCNTKAFFCTIFSLSESCKEVFKELTESGSKLFI